MSANTAGALPTLKVNDTCFMCMALLQMSCAAAQATFAQDIIVAVFMLLNQPHRQLHKSSMFNSVHPRLMFQWVSSIKCPRDRGSRRNPFSSYSTCRWCAQQAILQQPLGPLRGCWLKPVHFGKGDVPRRAKLVGVVPYKVCYNMFFFFEGDSLKYTTPNRLIILIMTFDDWANEGFLTGETPQQSK